MCFVDSSPNKRGLHIPCPSLACIDTGGLGSERALFRPYSNRLMLGGPLHVCKSESLHGALVYRKD